LVAWVARCPYWLESPGPPQPLRRSPCGVIAGQRLGTRARCCQSRSPVGWLHCEQVARCRCGWLIGAEASGFWARQVGGTWLRGQVRRLVLDPAMVRLVECLPVGGGQRGRARLGEPLLEVVGQDEHGRGAGEYYYEDCEDVVPLRGHRVSASLARCSSALPA